MEDNNKEESERKNVFFQGILALYSEVGELVYRMSREMGLNIHDEDERLYKAIEQGLEAGERKAEMKMFNEMLKPFGYTVYSATKLEDSGDRELFTIRVGKPLTN